MRLLNLTAAAVVGASFLSGCGNGSTKKAETEISVTACTADPAGGKPKAEGRIVNSTSKPSAYTFRVRFLDPSGNEVSQNTNAVARVEPAETAIWRLEGTLSAKGALTCKVDQATRTAVGT